VFDRLVIVLLHFLISEIPLLASHDGLFYDHE